MRCILALLACLIAGCLATGCGSEKQAEASAEDSVTTDTVAPDTTPDSIAPISEEPPAAADGLFDDFAYNFMRNKRFQKERIAFPLTHVVDGKTSKIEKATWRFDPIYGRQESYTMIFDSEKSLDSEKNTGLTHVTVEMIDLQKERIKQYVFNKTQGKWMLTAIDEHNTGDNVNADFYDFYKSFSQDTDFQNSHVDQTISFTTYDYDDFQKMEGIIDGAQWQDFKPDIPQAKITNINYGQDYQKSDCRVMVITSPSAGMSCTLTFKRRAGVWRLTAIDNV